jgi:hypothetical protein
MAPNRICTRNSASTIQKYFAVAFIEAVTRTMAIGSEVGSRARFSARP